MKGLENRFRNCWAADKSTFSPSYNLPTPCISLFSIHNSNFSFDQGLRPPGKISSSYTLGLYLRAQAGQSCYFLLRYGSLDLGISRKKKYFFPCSSRNEPKLNKFWFFMFHETKQNVFGLFRCFEPDCLPSSNVRFCSNEILPMQSALSFFLFEFWYGLRVILVN